MEHMRFYRLERYRSLELWQSRWIKTKYRFIPANQDCKGSRLAISYVWGPPEYTTYKLRVGTPSYPWSIYNTLQTHIAIRLSMVTFLTIFTRLIGILWGMVDAITCILGPPTHSIQPIQPSHTASSSSDRKTPSEKFAQHSEFELSIKLSSSFWHIDDFLDCLWNATKGQPFWLDQLSIPQNDENLSIQLYREIPKIYRTYPVRILANSTPCPLIESWKARKLDIEQVVSEQHSTYMGHPEKCDHCLRLSGWFDRLWPRQEGYYAKNLQLIYNSRLPQSFTKLKGPSSSASSTWFRSIRSGMEDNLRVMISDKIGMPLLRPTAEAPTDTSMKFPKQSQLELKFLRGDNLTFENKVSFDDSISRLGYFPRETTDQKDLVLAVWCDLPGYRIPHKAKKMSATELLEDAFRQYTRIRNRQVPLSYIRRFAGVEDSLRSYWIPPPKDARDTLSWYGQWRVPCKGIELDDNRRALGYYESIPVDLQDLDQYLAAHPTRVEIAKAIGRDRRKDHLLVLFNLLRRQANGKEIDESEVKLYKAAGKILLEAICPEDNPVGEELQWQNSQPGFEIAILFLLIMGIPVRLWKLHWQHIRFAVNMEDVWYPALCIDYSARPHVMHSEGVEWAYLVIYDRQQPGPASWRVVGVIPEKG